MCSWRGSVGEVIHLHFLFDQVLDGVCFKHVGWSLLSNNATNNSARSNNVAVFCRSSASCVMNRVTFALLANHESLFYFKPRHLELFATKMADEDQQPETVISEYEARPRL